MKFSRLLIVLAAIASLGASVGASSASDEVGPEKWRISCFAYRDDNRNGIFDMADRPYGGLLVEIERPDGIVVQGESNISGFANFDMAFGNRDKGQIYQAGLHKAKAVPPNGWETTSDAGEQEIMFVERKNAGGRMVAGNNCVPIGVAPALFIGGSVKRKSPDHKISVSVTPEGLGEVKLKLDDRGNYYTPVKPGKWLLRVVDDVTGTRIERDIHIKSHPVVVSEITDFDEPDALKKPLVTVSFDDLTVSDTLYEIPSGYGGLYWWNWIATHHKFYRGAGYVNGTVSSEFIAYNSSGHPAVMWSEPGTTFDFVGTYIGVAWPRAERDFIYVKAWKGEDLKHTQKLRLETSGAIYFQADYKGITKLEFTSGNYERIVLDDFSFRK